MARLYKWLGIYLVISFVWWFGAAVVEAQSAITGGVNRTRGLLMYFERQGWVLGFIQGWSRRFLDTVPDHIFVNQYVVDTDDTALFQYWLVWAALGVAVAGLIHLLCYAPGIRGSMEDFRAGWTGQVPAARPGLSGWAIAGGCVLAVLIALPWVL